MGDHGLPDESVDLMRLGDFADRLAQEDCVINVIDSGENDAIIIVCQDSDGRWCIHPVGRA